MFLSETLRVNSLISAQEKRVMSLEDIITHELTRWLRSSRRGRMQESERYYRNDTPVSNRRKDTGLHVSRLKNAFYKKLVDQKTGYLAAKPPSLLCGDKQLEKAMRGIFDKRFLSELCVLASAAVKKGIAFSQVCHDGHGRLRFVHIPAEEVIPLWSNAGHTALDAVIRVYDREQFSGRKAETVTLVEYYDKDGVRRYCWANGALSFESFGPHFTVDGEGKNWSRPPFVFVRYNPEELPLLTFLKDLFDDYDLQKSVCADMLINLPNFIYVLRNYGGEDLGEFVRQLRETLAISVEGDGGVEKLQAEPKTADAVRYLELARRDIYEFGRGVDTRSEFTGSASGVALRFLYADLDMDCNVLENSFQAMLEDALFFVTRHLMLLGRRDFSGSEVSFIFNRDIIISEAEAIEMCRESKGIVPDEVIAANHPWS